MRNLKIIHHSQKQFENSLPLTATTWDTVSNSIICAFGPSTSEQVIQIKKQVFRDGSPGEELLIASWDAPCPLPDLQKDEILDLHYFSHSNTSCLVLAGGDVVVVREQPLSGQEKIEIVGSVDAGITAAEWSPDEELLAITTRADTLLYMTADFDNVANITFNPEDAKLSKQVSVGWGKAETQFKGKRAKALRDPTVPEKVDEGNLSPYDRRQVTISWRGDGAFVSVNSVLAESRRMVRIFSRDGVLENVTEAVDGMEGALSWRPAGNLLAGVQRLEDEVKVIFFERNGLRHGDFSLRLTKEHMQSWANAIDLAWSIDSSTLAVKFCDRVQLWTMGNYHYYLKQEIPLGVFTKAKIPVYLSWHPEEPLRILTFILDQNEDASMDTSIHSDLPSIPESVLHSIRLVFDTSIGSTLVPYDYGFTAVVDGNTIKLTPLRKANVPPPMALFEIELQRPAIDVAFNSLCTRMAVLHHGSVSILHIEPRSGEAPTLEKSFPLPEFSIKTPLQICFTGELDVYVLAMNNGTAMAELLNVSQSRYSVIQPSEVLRLFHTSDYEGLYVVSGSTVSRIGFQASSDVELLENAANIETVNTFSNPCPWVTTYHGQRDITFGLSATGSLYADTTRLATNCTSFLVTGSHLIFTTTNHLVKFVHLDMPAGLDVPPDQPEADERCRNIERGALLVNVMPSTFSLTLQMPRGNLETIFPRALVLSAIRRNIDEKDYKKAFMACRSQRVDMNILYDYNPEQFLSNVELIVKQWSKTEYIDLFLSALREEDVTQSLYKETLQKPAINGDSSAVKGVNGEQHHSMDPLTGGGKVNGICDAFLAVLGKRYSTNLQNVITSHVCKIPPDVVAGLEVAADLKDTDHELADTAIEHICFLVDVNKVYEEALGLYNLDLTLLVAQQSQKDPREYMPYLQRLQEMPLLRRQFTIDHDLGRFSKALGYLHSMTEFDELKAYVQKHELYLQALNLYKYDQHRQPIILRLYAEFLESRNRFTDAAIAYESLTDYQAACNSYKAASMWCECLSCALLIPLPTDEVHSLAESLYEGQVELKDHTSAAIIQRDYLSNIESATQHFCKAYDFAEATRLVSLSAQPHLIPTVIDSGLMEGSGSMTELLADCKSQLEAQVPRLRELRKIKSQDPLAFFEGAVNADIPDNVSLAPTDATTSAGTFLTRYTNRTGTTNTQTTRKTSKNRRREERKRARGKKGSVYEEEYLVNSIGRLIDRVNEISGDVSKLVEGLLRRGMRERAEAVERAMSGVVETCKACVGEVFEVEKKVGLEGGNGLQGEGDDENSRPVGGDGVLWDSLEEARRGRQPPVIKPFVSSALLAH